MSIVTLNRGIRDQIVAPAADLPSKTRREKSEPPVMRPEVLNTRHSDYFQIPPVVWNSLVSCWTTGFRDLVALLASSYKERIEDTVGQLLDQGVPTLVYELGRRVIESVLLSVTGFMGSTIPCHQCEGKLEFERYQEAPMVTRLGKLSFKRAYYHGGCGHSAFPTDSLLGMDGEHRMLPELQELVAQFCTQAPYQPAAKLITGLLPIPCSHTTAERVTQTVATQLQIEQKDESQQAFSKDGKFAFPKEEPVKAAPVAVVSSDGGFCLVRDYKEKSKQFMVGVLGTLVPKPFTTWDEREVDVDNKRYIATNTEDLTSFYQLMAIEYHRMGLHRCPLLQCIGDGADGILPHLRLLADPTQEVFVLLDFFHAKEHVNNAAKALFRPDSDEQKAWLKLMSDYLLSGSLSGFFSELRSQHRQAEEATNEDRIEVLRETCHYFEKRREFLRYKEAIDRGLLIGSGIIEGAVRYVGKDRVDRTGMRWNIEGADAVLRLRAVETSGRWDAFRERQATRRAQRHAAKLLRWAA